MNLKPTRQSRIRKAVTRLVVHPEPSRQSIIVLIAVASMTILAVEPVLAQTTGTAFCTTDMATTLKNVFELIQFGGPLLGGTVALGATLGLAFHSSIDKQQEYRTLRRNGLIYGVLMAPLATAIIQFILNNVVTGGVSCGF